MSDLFQDSVNLFRPNEWFGICVVYSDKFLDGSDQIRHTLEHTTANTLAGDLPKPPFNKIEPRGRSRCEVAMKAGMLFQPCFDLGVIVGTIVVQDHMDCHVLGSFAVNLPQKLSEFDVAMPRITRADDLSLQQIQRCKQAGSAIAFVIVRLCNPWLHTAHCPARTRQWGGSHYSDSD